MSDNKELLEGINRSVEAIRTKAEDSVSKAELDNVVGQIKALQDSVAAANSFKAHDEVEDADARAKADVGLFFTEGRDAIKSERNGEVRFKDDSTVAAITVNPQGGYLLPKVFNDLVDGNLRKFSPLRAMAKVVQGNLGYVTPIKTTQGTAGQRGEFDPLFYSAAPKYDLLNHTFQEINSTEALSVWADLNSNAIVDFTQSVIQDVTESMAEQECSFFMNGAIQMSKQSGGTVVNGLLKQTKLVGDQFSNVTGSIAGVETTGTEAASNPISPDDLINLLFSLHTRYDANTSIMTSREVVKSIITTKDSQNRYLLDVGGPQDGFAARILGKALVISDFFPALASAGDVPVALAADFRQAVTIVDASPVRWLVDPYTDKRMLQYTGRRMTSSAVVNPNAIRALYVKHNS